VAALAGCGSTPTATVEDRTVGEYPEWVQPRRAKSPEPPKPPQGAAAADRPEPKESDWRPDSYVVKKGDTLFSIALDHGLAYRDLAAWNALADPNVIRAGQTLRLKPPAGWSEEAVEEPAVVARAATPPAPIEAQPLDAPPLPPVKSAPKGFKLAYSEQTLAKLRNDLAKPAPTEPAKPVAPVTAPSAAAPVPAVEPAKPAPSAPAVTAKPAARSQAPAPPPADAAAPAGQDEAVAWSWPARGKLLHAYNQGPNPKGIAIGGNEGQPVVASAPGKVVYAGSGLRGYGKLIIIKHNGTYLSVYAHNRALLVKEGDRVGKSQKIAEMGSSDADQVELHFEIRRLGKPVDPLKYLPQEGAHERGIGPRTV
jgi:lipoprotein NlpD